MSPKPYFSLGPVFSEWGRENLVREVFQDTELEIFPWQGTLKVSHVYFGPLQHGWFSIFVWDWGRRHQWGRRHELLRHNCGLAVALAWSVHNFNSEQRNCLVILSLSGSDLNLKWKLDLSLIRIVWFRVNVRSVELSSTRTWEFQTPTQDISIPWTQHQGPSLTGNTPHFDLNQIKIDVNFLPPPLSQGHLGIVEFAGFEDLGKIHSFF